MYNNERSIELIVDLLKENNIKKIVISPGGTNIPIVKRIQVDSFFECYSIVDERSALYFAVGLYLQSKEYIAVVCTSAQATRNYIPGLTEAFYKKVPILAITMEKHPRFKYQGYMQAPDQTSLPIDCIKKSYELPFVHDINDFYHSKRLINEAILELNHNGLGPVQLCVPWLDFKIDEIEHKITKIERNYINEIEKINFDNKKLMIIIGENLEFNDVDKKIIDEFCERTNCFIYTNHLSNFHNKFSINANFLLSTINDDEFEILKPDIILSIGGQTGDYPLYLRFSKTKYNDIENWLISEDGNVMDTYDKLTKIYQGKVIDFFKKVESKKGVDHTLYNVWNDMNKRINSNIELPFSNAYIAQYMHKIIPEESIMQFSILNSLRVWNLFDLPETIKCYSNVAAFGIDGGMSTLIGQSMITNNLAFMIIGDLAFYYDMNSLGIRHIKNNLRILLINNNGGVEFKLHGENRKETDKYIAAANHFKNAKAWAESCNFIYYSANSIKEFKDNVDNFISFSDRPIIFEIFTNDIDEKEAYTRLIEANKQKDFVEELKYRIKGKIKEKIGNEIIEKIKRR